MMKKPPLHSYITNLTKEEIHYIAATLGDKIPMSWNKEKMSLALAAIYERDPMVLRPMLSMATIAFAAYVFKEKLNGAMELSEDTLGSAYESAMDSLCELEYLGLAYVDWGRFLIADVVKKAVSGFPDKGKDQLRQWQQMEFCAYGILVAYGILEKGKYAELFRGCYPELTEEEAAVFLNRRIGLRLHSSRLDVDGKEEWVYCDCLLDPDGWYELVQSRRELPYRIYAKDEYIHFYEEGFPWEPENYQKLIGMLAARGMDEEAAKDALFDEVMRERNKIRPDTAVPQLIEEFEWQSEKELRAFINLYFPFTNDIPL